MVKNVFFLLLIVFSFFINSNNLSCAHNLKSIKIEYYNTTDTNNIGRLESIRTIEYDKKGNIIRDLHENFSNNFSSEFINKYNEWGEVIEQKNFVKYAQSPAYGLKIKKSYNDKNKIRECSYYDINEKLKSIEKCFYDVNGNLIEKRLFDHKNNFLHVTEKYFYDKNNNIIKKEKINANLKDFDCEYEKNYSDDNLLIEELYYQDTGVHRIIYKYKDIKRVFEERDEKNSIVYKYSFNLPSEKIIYSVKKKNQIENKIIYHYENSRLVREDHFNSKSKMVHQKYYNNFDKTDLEIYFGKNSKPEIMYKYKFDKFGNEIKKELVKYEPTGKIKKVLLISEAKEIIYY
ncbi:MAG: hypothetical protein JXB50_14675 [Spirochaetes bacterium]|nr:hypothetical protein [Spirochaetota bacterium]